MNQLWKFLASLFTITCLFSFTAGNTYKIDLGKSGITWHAPITSGEHYGTIKVNSGYIVYDGQTIASGIFTIDMNSVKDLDLEAKKQPAIEAHIKSEDFFETAKYPYATFKIERVQRDAKNALRAYGSLTIKNITKSISFPIKVRTIENKVYVDADKIEINRKDFGVQIKNKGLKGKLEEAVIDDVFHIGFSIVLE
jgi:polyisoprenoid-binding protein YceI